MGLFMKISTFVFLFGLLFNFAISIYLLKADYSLEGHDVGMTINDANG